VENPAPIQNLDNAAKRRNVAADINNNAPPACQLNLNSSLGHMRCGATR
jgi:hypothetical protein